MKPLYEELKKIYDWNEDESRKSKPRIKGDQRMYHESNEKPCSTEPLKDQIDPSEVHDGPTETPGKYHLTSTNKNIQKHEWSSFSKKYKVWKKFKI